MTFDPDPDPEPFRYTGHLIRRAQQLHVATWMRLVSTDISTVQYAVLVVLDQDGPMSQRDLCDAVALDRSTIADLVARMERHDLVSRQPDPDDGRRRIVGLTDHGRAEHARLRPGVEQVEEELTGSLAPETREALRSALRTLLVSTVLDR